MGEPQKSNIRVLVMGAALAAVSAVGGALGTASLKWFNDRATGSDVTALAVKVERLEKQTALGETIPDEDGDRTVAKRLLKLEDANTAGIERDGIEAMDRAAVRAAVDAILDVGIEPKRRSAAAKAVEVAGVDVEDKFDASKLSAREAAAKAVNYARSRRR